MHTHTHTNTHTHKHTHTHTTEVNIIALVLLQRDTLSYPNTRTHILKEMRVERETLGVELYGIQQQLACQQMLMEREQDKHTTLHQLRVQREETLAQVREMYRSMHDQVKRERQQSK